MASASLDRTYTYHPPFGTQTNRYQAIREFGKAFAKLITESTPPSREQSLALTKVQESVMWANAAIAIHEIEPVSNPTDTTVLNA